MSAVLTSLIISALITKFLAPFFLPIENTLSTGFFITNSEIGRAPFLVLILRVSKLSNVL